MILQRGRVFGLVNIVDAAVVVGSIGILALAVLAYRAMIVPEPRVDAIVPNAIADAATTVQIRGAFLRPFVRVFLTEAGRPPTMSTLDPAMRSPAPLEAKPKFVASSIIDLEVPALTPGRYDVYVFDDDHQLARLPSALTVARPVYPRATIEVLARFFTYDDVIEAMTGSDKGKARGPAPAVASGALVRDIRRGPEVEEVQMRLAKYPGQEPFVFYGNRRPRRVIDVRLDVPAVMTAADRWEYRGKPLRAGESMTLDMPMHFEGEIIWVGEPRREP